MRLRPRSPAPGACPTPGDSGPSRGEFVGDPDEDVQTIGGERINERDEVRSGTFDTEPFGRVDVRKDLTVAAVRFVVVIGGERRGDDDGIGENERG